MKCADVSSLDGRTVMALIIGTIRADRFCEGTLLTSFERWSIAKWLSRLKRIDEAEGLKMIDEMRREDLIRLVADCSEYLDIDTLKRVLDRIDETDGVQKSELLNIIS